MAGACREFPIQYIGKPVSEVAGGAGACREFPIQYIWAPPAMGNCSAGACREFPIQYISWRVLPPCCFRWGLQRISDPVHYRQSSNGRGLCWGLQRISDPVHFVAFPWRLAPRLGLAENFRSSTFSPGWALFGRPLGLAENFRSSTLEHAPNAAGISWGLQRISDPVHCHS